LNTLTDEQLIEILKDGESGAIDELYRRYSKKLYVFCQRIASSENPEDMVHDVFVRVIEAAGRFNPQKASFSSWLFRIARNHCIDIARRSEKVKFIPLDVSQDDGEIGISIQNSLADNNEDVENSLIKTSLIKAVRECIGELKEQEKSVILLYYMGDNVYREIGRILGKSISMVRNILKSAQDKIRICLERKGIDSFS